MSNTQTVNKSKTKLEIKSLKRQRDAAINQKDYKKLAEVRKQIHDLKGKLRRSIKQK